jgi:hypothetical protein
MKRLTVLAFLLPFAGAWAQQTPPPPTPGAASQQQIPARNQSGPPELAPVSELSHPERFAVSFLPLDKGNEGIAFLVAPNGKAGSLPIRNLAEAFNAGYRPFTVADLLAVTSAVADEEKNLQRRIKELSEDYDALASRYNRLAAINSSAPVQAQPVFDERQAMRAGLFRALLQRSFPPPPSQIQVQTVDCTKFPAFCINH